MATLETMDEQAPMEVQTIIASDFTSSTGGPIEPDMILMMQAMIASQKSLEGRQHALEKTITQFANSLTPAAVETTYTTSESAQVDAASRMVQTSGSMSARVVPMMQTSGSMSARVLPATTVTRVQLLAGSSSPRIGKVEGEGFWGSRGNFKVDAQLGTIQRDRSSSPRLKRSSSVPRTSSVTRSSSVPSPVKKAAVIRRSSGVLNVAPQATTVGPAKILSVANSITVPIRGSSMAVPMRPLRCAVTNSSPASIVRQSVPAAMTTQSAIVGQAQASYVMPRSRVRVASPRRPNPLGQPLGGRMVAKELFSGGYQESMTASLTAPSSFVTPVKTTNMVSPANIGSVGRVGSISLPCATPATPVSAVPTTASFLSGGYRT